MTEESITLKRPDDWHLHLRDGAMMEGVLPHSAKDFARAIIMPNLVPPVVTGQDAAAYRDRILAALPEGAAFEPLMTLYLTEDTDPADVKAAANIGPGEGRETLSRRGHHEFGQWRAGFRQGAGHPSRPWPRSVCRSAFMARSPDPRSTSSIAKRSSSTKCLIPSAAQRPVCAS